MQALRQFLAPPSEDSVGSVLRSRIGLMAGAFMAIRLLLLLWNNPNFEINSDEELAWRIAHNWLSGLDYTHFRDGVIHKSALHSSFNVFLWIALQWCGLTKSQVIVGYDMINTALLGVSVIYFYLLARRLLERRSAELATWLFCLYPSVLCFIGPLHALENLSIAFILTTIYYLDRMMTGRPVKASTQCALLCMDLISIMLRPQTLLVFAPLYLVVVSMALKRRRSEGLALSAALLLGLLLTHLPVLKKNHRLFGAYVLNTQVGFELLQGHNPTARGSWMGGWRDQPANPLYVYAHENIPGLSKMNEIEESDARKALAVKWVKENPWAELKLCVRKLAIYFLPANFEMLPRGSSYNPVNLLVHLGFFYGFCLLMATRRTEVLIWLLLAPVAGSVALTLVFFMGARWRYYAEPTMILFTAVGVQHMLATFFSERKSQASPGSIPCSLKSEPSCSTDSQSEFSPEL